MKAKIRVTGAVQGVGYRPFVAELAKKYHLNGEVRNSGGIVDIIAEGLRESIDSFIISLKTDSPRGSVVKDISFQIVNECKPGSPSDFSGFHIVQSTTEDKQNFLSFFPPDIGICKECISELENRENRRYRYPLISCTSCGPRYSILKSFPYDRENITMEKYKMCDECSKEYILGRRRHAQTISCHNCGPQYYFKCLKNVSKDYNSRTNSSNGNSPLDMIGNEGVKKVCSIIEEGGIIGLKGIGGYQLLCSPFCEEAVSRLRNIKGRETKPFAVMFSSIDAIRQYCKVGKTEKEYLESAARPIVLLDKKSGSGSVKKFSDNVCGRSSQIGAFLPASGIHVILTEILGEIIVTSGNISGNPMIISDEEFEEKFARLVDGILYYDREILRPLDDSVLQVVRLYDGSEIPRFIRRARGYVPTPVFLNNPMKDEIFYLSFGADLKNTFCIGYKDRLIQSQFFGDMDKLSIIDLQKKEMSETLKLFWVDKLKWDVLHIISDMHPGYASVREAGKYYEECDKGSFFEKKGFCKELISIQHHHAHIGSVMAENSLKECIGIAFDGTGYGPDNTIWGSEFMLCRDNKFKRIMHFKSVPIVGGDEAMKNAKACATSFLYDANISEAVCDESEDRLIRAAIKNGINTYKNSGMGRIFDAVSSILGICDFNSYEGECAMLLQNSAEEYLEESKTRGILPNRELLKISEKDGVLDTAELIKDLWYKKNKMSAGELSYIFHRTIAYAVLNSTIKIRKIYGIKQVALSGGVFINRLLFGMCVRLLKDEDFMVYYNRNFPSNDGGISIGQIYLDSLREE